MKKGQGALEFLMTYGWAFLVILIMIAALAYFGVLNPQQWLPDRCNFGSESPCEKGKFVLDNNDPNVMFTLVNNFGQSVKVRATTTAVSSSIWGNTPPTLDGFDCDPGTGAVDCTVVAGVTWQEGQTMEFIADLAVAEETKMIVDEKVKVQVKMKWWPNDQSESFSHSLEGEIFSAVQ